MPKALEQQPTLNIAQEQLLQAFLELSASRTVGLAVNPISIADALAYADAAGFDHKLQFLTVIREADQVFLEYAAEQQEKNGSRKTRGKG